MQYKMAKTQVILTVLFATALLLLLAFFLLFFLIRYRIKSNQYIKERENLKKEYEQTLLQTQIEVQENTLAAVGRELHDNIGQLLTSTKLLIGITQQKLQVIPDTLNLADEVIGKAINEVRLLSKSLDTEWLQQFNFIANMQTEVSRLNATGMLQINFSYSKKLLLQPEEQLIIFRIVQEALQNAVKHSKAQNIDISVNYSVASLIITVADNGIGLGNIHLSGGLGLKNMKHRAQLLGGTIDWTTLPDEGSTVILKLPAKKYE